MANRVSFIIIAKDAFTVVGKKVAQTTGKMRKGFKGLSADLGLNNEKFKNLILSMGAYLGVRRLLSEGTKFQDSIADLSAITGAAGEDLAFLSDEALKLAKMSKTNASKVAEGFKLVASAKAELLEDPTGLSKVTEQVLLLANASGIDLSLAATTVTESLNQFGKGAGEAAKFVDILAAGAKFGASEIADTGAAVVIAGPNARAAGLSFLQLNAAIQTTAKGGIKGAQAGTALSAIFSRLRQQGFDFQKLGLAGTFEKVKKKLDRVTNSTRRAQLEAKIFGQEHGKVGLAILNNLDSLGGFEKQLRIVGIAQKQADVRMATFSARMRLVGIIVNEKLIRVFEELAPHLESMGNDFAGFIDLISTEEIQAFVEGLKLIASAAILVGKAVRFMLTALKGVGIAIGELAGQVVTGNFSVEQGTSPIEAFSIGGKFIGDIFGDSGLTPTEAAATVKETIVNGTTETVRENVVQNINVKSEADINIKVNDPGSVLESVKTTAKTPNLNMGVNMETASG